MKSAQQATASTDTSAAKPHLPPKAPHFARVDRPPLTVGGAADQADRQRIAAADRVTNPSSPAFGEHEAGPDARISLDDGRSAERTGLSAGEAPSREVSHASSSRGPASAPIVPTSHVELSETAVEEFPAAAPALAADPSPVVDARPLLTVDLAINACLLADPQLRVGWEAISQSNAHFLQSSLKPNPTFSASQTLMPLSRPFTVNAQGGPPQFDAGLAVPIDWFLFGKRAAHMAVAERGVRVSEADYADLIRRRVVETALAYYELVAAQGLLELTEQDLDNLRKVETATKEAVDNGGKPAIDVQRIRVISLAGEALRRDSLAAVLTARSRLNVLMGRTGNDLSAAVPSDLPEPPAPTSMSPDEALALARESRPDLRALRWSVSEAEAQIESACQDGKPSVTPRIGYTRQFQQKAIGYPDANSFGFGLDMTLPVHDRNQGNINKAISELRQSQWALQSAELELTSEIVSTSELVNAAYENATTVNREQLELARQVRDAVQTAYEAGGRPLIDVLDAQRVYREAYRQFIQARVNYWKARTRYQGAIGSQVMP